MKKIILFLLFLFFNSVSAQKTSSVSGDIITLMDLLGKDYGLNPENREEVLVVDRAKAISILNSYTNPPAPFDLHPAAIDYKAELEAIKKAEAVYKELSGMNLSVNAGYKLATVNGELAAAWDAITTAKDAYYLKKYNADSQSFNWLLASYAENTYMSYIVKQFQTKYQALEDNNFDIYAQRIGSTSINKAFPIGGGVSLKMLVDGLSQFIAESIKKELTLYAIEKIRNYLEHPSDKNLVYELTAVLPATTRYLRTFTAEQLLNFNDQLKQYLEDDLNNILKNAQNLKNTPRVMRYIKLHPDLEFAFEGLAIISKLSEIKNPIDYFEILENSRALNAWASIGGDTKKYNIAQSIRLMSMLAYSLTINDNNEQKFVSVDLLSAYAYDKNFYLLYVGLLNQQNENYFKISFKNSSGVATKLDFKDVMRKVDPYDMDKVSENMTIIKQSLIPIIEHAEKIYNLSQDLRKQAKSESGTSYMTVHDFVEEIISFSEEIGKSTGIMSRAGLFGDSLTFLTLNDKIGPYIQTAKAANEIVRDLQQKNYSTALDKAIGLSFTLLKSNEALNPFVLTDNKIETVVNTYGLEYLKTLVDKSSDAMLIHDSNLLKPKLEALRAHLVDKGGFESLTSAIDNFIAAVPDPLAISLFAPDKQSIISASDNLRIALKRDALKMVKSFDVIKYFKDAIQLDHLGSQVDSEALAFLNETMLDYMVNMFNHYAFDEQISKHLSENLNGQLELFQVYLKDLKPADDKAVRIIGFLNDMALSKDSEDVEKAISKFADRTGTSSLKDNSSLNITLNTFPGLFTGGEITKDIGNAYFIGFTAPVGLYVQFLRSRPSWGSIGLFLPVIDIGAPVRLRLDSDRDTEALPDFELEDIIAPGLFISYGLPKAPFAFNLGIQYGPKMRDIPSTIDGVTQATSFTSVDSYRIGLAIVIDIPILTITNKYPD